MAKKPQVICPICKEKFYREDEEFVQEGRRYYHLACHEQKEHIEEYTNKIHEYCRKIYGDKYVKSRIDNQIKELLNDGTGKTITGIYRSLVWHYEKNNGDIEKAFGSIRIVGYIYNDAEAYYKQQWETEQRNAALASSIQKSETEVFHIHPQSIKKPKRVNLFDIN